MADAEVGDDVFGDDPTVIELQERVAKILNKEAGLFVPTGRFLYLNSNYIPCRLLSFHRP